MSNGGAAFWSHQFIDSSGNPYSGVKLYHTAAGTDTLKNVWTDEGKVTPAANPVVGDSSGMVSFYADGDYKFVIKDTNNVTLYTWDNIKITSDTATMWEGNAGTAYPSAATANRFQQFVKHTAGNEIIEIGINKGSAFMPLTLGVYASAFTNFTDAVTQAAGKVLFIDASITLPAGAITIPSNVSVFPLQSGIINKGSATSLTINGPPVGNPMHQWLSGFNAGEVLFGVNSLGKVPVVYSEWFGAIPVAYESTPNDDSVAIQSALSSGADVKLLKGRYGFASALTMSKDGQTLEGSGRYLLSDNNGGTILTRKSGFSGVGLTVGPFVGQCLHNLVLDGNSIDGGINGNLLKINISQYPTVQNLRIINCGGNDAAMVVTSVSIGNFRNIDFAGNYANLYCANDSYGVLATNFENISLGACTDNTQLGLYVYGGEGLTFTKVYSNSRMKIYGDVTTPADAITFNDLYTEFNTTEIGASPQFIIEGGAAGNVKNVKINGHKHIQNDATTQLFMDVKNVYGFKYSSVNFQDNGSAAGRDLIRLNGVLVSRFEDIQVYNISGNAADLIVSTGTRSDDIEISNIMGTGGTILTCDWKATRLKLENMGSSITHTFQAGTGSVIINNVSGTITTTNISEGSIPIWDGITAPNTITGIAQIYVDKADEDLKIKFGDGTIKTIVVDT